MVNDSSGKELTLHPWLFNCFYLLVLLSFASIYILLPALPSIATTFHLPITHTRSILTLIFFGQFISTLSAGWIAQKIGVRNSILGGACIIFASAGMTIFSDSYQVLKVNIFLLGLGSGVFSPIIYSLTALLVTDDRRRRIIGMLVLMSVMPAVIIPIISGYLVTLFGWHSAFAFLLLIASIAIILASITFPKSLFLSKPEKNMPTSHSALYHNKKYFVPTFTTCFLSGALAIILVELPFLATIKLQVSSHIIGLYFGASAVFYIIGIRLSRLLSNHLSTIRIFVMALMIVNLATYLYSFFFLMQDINEQSICIVLFIFMFGYGISMPNAIFIATTAIANTPFKFTGNSISASLRLLSNFVFSLAATALSFVDPSESLFLFLPTITTLVAIVFILNFKKMRC